jgi:2,3-dihydroxyphenylpropionate 1,2-dioxygenase
MPQALVAMSHSPLLEHTDPPAEVKQAVEESFAAVKKFVQDFQPDLIVNFGPDHYNGFFQDLAPHYCIALAAHGTGDYNSFDGDLDVPTELAEQLAAHVVAGGVDVATSRKMEVDHGAVQPAEILFDGDPSVKPMIPIFVNALVKPFCGMDRVRALGHLVGEFFKDSDKRVLFIGSGGLSHDPPVPRYHEATPEQRAFLVSGRNPTPEQRAAREARTIATAKAFAAGEADIMELNPEWDKAFLDICRSGEVERFDAYQAEEMEQAAGHSVHEVRTWVAAYSALRACGEYELAYEFYMPIKEYIAGFGVTAAVLK